MRRELRLYQESDLSLIGIGTEYAQSELIRYIPELNQYNLSLYSTRLSLYGQSGRTEYAQGAQNR